DEADGFFELDRHFERRLPALARVAFEPAQHDAVERGRDASRMRARRLDLTLQYVVQGVGFVLAAEQSATGQRFPEHDGRREDVRLPSHGRSGYLLRRHVGELALELSFAG